MSFASKITTVNILQNALDDLTFPHRIPFITDFWFDIGIVMRYRSNNVYHRRNDQNRENCLDKISKQTLHFKSNITFSECFRIRCGRHRNDASCFL